MPKFRWLRKTQSWFLTLTSTIGVLIFIWERRLLSSYSQLKNSLNRQGVDKNHFCDGPRRLCRWRVWITSAWLPAQTRRVWPFSSRLQPSVGAASHLKTRTLPTNQLTVTVGSVAIPLVRIYKTELEERLLRWIYCFSAFWYVARQRSRAAAWSTIGLG